MPSMKSINSRRGGGGTPITSSLISSYSLWKYLLLGTFIVLASLSFHLIHQVFPNSSSSNRNNNHSDYQSGESFSNNIVLVTNEEDTPPNAVHIVTNATKELQRQNINEEKSHHTVVENTKLPATITATNTTKTLPSSPKKREEESLVINISPNYLQHLQSLGPFPKKLHILFPHKDYYKQHPSLPFVQHSILRFMELNPTWNVTIYNDADMDGIIERAARDDMISMEEMRLLLGNETLSAAHPVERADLARMLIIWYHGGMYVDADALINPKQFDKVFLPTIKMCLPIYLDINFAQSILCSSPKNQLYLEMIKQMSKRRMTSNKGGPLERRDGWATTNALFSMGPPLFNHVIFDLVFGNSHVSGHGDIPGIEDTMRVLQEEASGVIATGQFHDGCHSFLADPFEGCKDWERGELYKLYNMSGW
eukprot:CAMPEP_0172319000 /NCGR_PEP_ID=MMETSP1058-20130122/36461_1 /TAXON_ID=83371 /ORGANISM="Detonula confervacea, Strain CCMP 353" /LENGTH=423 /DNA_ID=CAMNT_0013033937 /DNA_START=176 /DNA_END=1444 /DNA_ORIENTATION=+